MAQYLKWCCSRPKFNSLILLRAWQLGQWSPCHTVIVMDSWSDLSALLMSLLSSLSSSVGCEWINLIGDDGTGECFRAIFLGDDSLSDCNCPTAFSAGSWTIPDDAGCFLGAFLVGVTGGDTVLFTFLLALGKYSLEYWATVDDVVGNLNDMIKLVCNRISITAFRFAKLIVSLTCNFNRSMAAQCANFIAQKSVDWCGSL